MSDEIILDSPGDLEADRIAGAAMRASMQQLREYTTTLGAMSHDEKVAEILDMRKPQNRKEWRQAGRTNKRPVLLADVIDWQSGAAKGTTTEGMKPSVRAVKRKSAGKLR